MSIIVVCPGCKKSFQVSEKFAGKTGPCPKCKTTIKIPAKSQEVKIHGGEEFASGGRTASGQLALKPIARKPVKVNPQMIGAIAGAAVGVMIVCWIGGKVIAAVGLFAGYTLVTLGLLLLSPVLVFAAYQFLYDDELEPYRAKELYIRSAACAATYIVLWGLLAYVKGNAFDGPLELVHWAMMLPPMILLGSATAYLALDLEPGSAFSHYAFYLVVTCLLAWIAGIPVWT